MKRERMNGKIHPFFAWKNALLACVFARQVVERAVRFCYHDK